MELSANGQAIAYLISAILFIFALKGLTHPASARNGNYFGMAGMAIAVVATLMGTEVQSYGFIIAGVAAGAVIGSIMAARVEMTAMPQLVAALHSFVGMAAVLVAIGTFLNKQAANELNAVLMGELSAGIIIGAITFSGSVIAFGKLQGLISGAPVIFKGQHLAGAGHHRLRRAFCNDRQHQFTGHHDCTGLYSRFYPDYPHRWCRYAGDYLHAQQLFGLGSSSNRFHAAKQPADYCRCNCRFFRCDSFLHHV